MKTKFGMFALGIGLTSLALCVGCEEDQAAAGTPLFANVAPAYAEDAAEADPQAAPSAKPAEAPPPVAKNEPPPAPAAVPPGSIVITKASLTNAAATNLVQAPPAQPPQLSPALAEVVRLIQANVGAEVLLAYITNSTLPFYVGANEIVYLHDLGAPTTIITALINADATPEMAARKAAAVSVKPLPPGVAATEPVISAPVPRPPPPAAQAVPNPPEPVPVNPPANTGTVYAGPPPEGTTVTYEYPQEVNYNYFYTSLSPYGSWVDVPGYGSCWRPTVATWNSSWRPYLDGGRWLWSDAGWYWYSDYSWGWAPFHYGRWHRPAGYGWVWSPDTVWGPSWVSWRYSAGYCGWAPLPPTARYVSGLGFYYNTGAVGFGFEFGLGYSDYCYIPSARFCDRRPVNHCLPPNQNASVHKDTTVINNYVVGNNNTIINNGPGFDKVAKVTRGDIKRIALRDTSSVKDLGTRHERLEADGQTLTVYRPPTSTLTRKSVVSAPGQPSGSVVRPAAAYVKPAVSGGQTTVSGGAATPAYTAPAGVKAHAAPNTPVRSGPTPVTLYTKPSTPANQPVIVTGGTTPKVPYTRPAASGSGVQPMEPSRVTKPTVASTGRPGATAVDPRGDSRSGSSYIKPGGSAGGSSTVYAAPTGRDPIKSSAPAYTVPPSTGTRSATAPKSISQAESPRAYSQPSAPRATAPSQSSGAYNRPAAVAPSQSYSRPSAPAPSQSYSRPASAPSGGGGGGNHSRVSAPSGGSSSGGSSGKSSGSSSSGNSSGDKKGR